MTVTKISNDQALGGNIALKVAETTKEFTFDGTTVSEVITGLNPGPPPFCAMGLGTRLNKTCRKCVKIDAIDPSDKNRSNKMRSPTKIKDVDKCNKISKNVIKSRL